MIVDTILPLFPPFRPAACAAGRNGGKFFRIDHAEVAMAETHNVIALVALGEADHFAGQGLADEYAFAAPSDLAAGVDAPDLVMGVVPGVADPRGHRPRGGAPDSCRRPLLQRLVRTLLVEVLAKHIEALLLFARAERRWLRRLLRQRAVHPLVSTIVLRRSRTAEMRLDAQLQQPYRQSRKPTRARRSERRAVVGADRLGKPEVPEKPLENRSDRFMVRPENPYLQQIAARVVRHRQRIDAPPVARAEPTFEIHAPLAVHRKNRRRRRALNDRSALPPNLLDQPSARQNIADRRKRRPVQFRRVQLQAKSKLLRTKMRKPMPHGHDPLYHRGFRPARNVLGRMTAILKPHRIAAQPSLPPQIKCLATDAVAFTQLRHAERPRVVVAQHPNPLFHRTGLSKRHRKALPTTILTCQPSSRFNLSGIYPVHTGLRPPFVPPLCGRDSKPGRTPLIVRGNLSRQPRPALGTPRVSSAGELRCAGWRP